MRIKWKGKKRTNAALEQYQDSLERKVKRIVVETTESGVSKMKADCPVDEGALRRSIQPSYSNDHLSSKIRVGQFYGIFVEIGTGIFSKEGTGRKDPWVYWSDDLHRWVFTRGIRPQPYFFHNADWMKNKFKREMRGL